MSTTLERLKARWNAGHRVCVGLDPELKKIPEHLKGPDASDAFFTFCAPIVKATAPRALVFKPQIAYFAAQRAEPVLERLITYIRQVAPEVPVILDAKRGDIGSTAEQYAREAFERYAADAVTLSPYMGYDSVEPYLQYPGKMVFLLCRTSNPGGDDLQNQILETGEPLYVHVARLAQEWEPDGRIGLVVGATYPDELARVREVAPNAPLLVPGIGAQGGDVEKTIRAGKGGLLVVNSSRGIIYASKGEDFADRARDATVSLTEQILAAERAL